MSATKPSEPIKAAISISEMCRQLRMSRSQFYAHVKKGTFHSPLKLANGRPYFNASQVEDNLAARASGVGVNGEYVLFYERSTEPKPQNGKKVVTHEHSQLIASLGALGITSVTNEQVQSAIESCFPQGIKDEDETTVLRAVFRHLKRSGTV